MALGAQSSRTCPLQLPTFSCATETQGCLTEQQLPAVTVPPFLK